MSDSERPQLDLVDRTVSRLSWYDRGVMLATGLVGLAGVAVAYVTLGAYADRIAVWAGWSGGLGHGMRLGILVALIGLLAAGAWGSSFSSSAEHIRWRWPGGSSFDSRSSSTHL